MKDINDNPKKFCVRCGLSLPLTEFRKDLKEPDGLKKYCKECAHRDVDKPAHKPKIDCVEIKFNELGGRI